MGTAAYGPKIRLNIALTDIFSHHYLMPLGTVTMTTEVGTNGATTFSCMNSSGYVGHVTIFSLMLTIACCLVVGLELGLGLVSGWLVVMHTYLY